MNGNTSLGQKKLVAKSTGLLFGFYETVFDMKRLITTALGYIYATASNSKLEQTFLEFCNASCDAIHVVKSILSSLHILFFY